MDSQPPPQLVDFGLTEEMVAGLPEPFVAGHRPSILASGFALTVAASAMVSILLTGSFVAAVVFGLLLVCGASVLLMPAAVAVVCAAEAAEKRWLCRRFAAYQAWCDYQTALAAHRGADARRRRDQRLRLRRWHELPADRLCESVAGLLERQGWRVERLPADLDAGVELRAARDGRSVVVRCVAGDQSWGPSLVRELVTCRSDFGADEAWLVAPAGGSKALEESLDGRPVVLIDAGRLVAVEEGASWS